MVDTSDLKSDAKSVGVRVPSLAPNKSMKFPECPQCGMGHLPDDVGCIYCLLEFPEQGTIMDREGDVIENLKEGMYNPFVEPQRKNISSGEDAFVEEEYDH